MTRINKYLAEHGIASRRAAENYIREGKVRINGETITELGYKVAATDQVVVNGEKITCQPKRVYIILNKPTGTVTTCKDQFNRKTVLDLISNVETRIFPIGRLDYETEGILLLTNDGDFARKLTHPSSEIPKTYAATLNKPVSPEQLEKLRTGAGYNPPKDLAVSGSMAYITITEGRNRQVRKMFETVGLRVRHLRRTQIGNLTLGSLKTGEWRYLSQQEVGVLSIPKSDNMH